MVTRRFEKGLVTSMFSRPVVRIGALVLFPIKSGGARHYHSRVCLALLYWTIFRERRKKKTLVCFILHYHTDYFFFLSLVSKLKRIYIFFLYLNWDLYIYFVLRLYLILTVFIRLNLDQLKYWIICLKLSLYYINTFVLSITSEKMRSILM